MKIIHFSIIGFCALLFSGNSVFSQDPVPVDSGKSYFIASKIQTGYIVKNGHRVASLVNDNVRMYQMDFSVLKNTQRSWDYCHCYTKTGVSLSYVDFGNPVNLGHAVNLIVFTEPYLSLSKKIHFTVRGGAGFSYLNKIYNAETNPDNIFYSQHLSFLLMLNANLYYSLTQQVRLSLTAQYDHISNGGIHSPNWGINFPMIGLGVEYKLDQQELKKGVNKPFTDRSVKLIAHLFSGAHTVNADTPFPEEKLFVMGSNIGFIWPLTLVNGLGVGGEFYYDGASKALQLRTGYDFTNWVASLSLQHYIFFGKLIFSQQLAIYVTPLNPDVNNVFYQRYFLEYQVHGPWYAGISLKSHGDVSDYLSFTVSRIFNLKQMHN